MPDKPIAIIVPVSLVSQWRGELKTFIWRKNIEVYVFPPAAADWLSFWSPTSDWNISTHPMYLRIIIFQHLVRGNLVYLSYPCVNKN